MLKVGYREEVPDQTAESQFDQGEPVSAAEELDNLRREHVLLVIPEGFDSDTRSESIQQLPCDSEGNHWGSHHRLISETLDEVLVSRFQIIVLLLIHPRW